VTILLAAFTQALHIALMLVAAPIVVGLQHWTEARLAGRTGPPPWQPWRDLARLSRKRPVLAENASPLFRTVPLACVAASFVAAALVPSFTLGMAFAPLDDLLVLAGLLAFGRVGLALAAMDAGTGQAGLAAGRTAWLGCLAEPSMFLAVLALGLLGGTTNLDLLIGQQQQGMLQPSGAAALAGAALVVLAAAGPDSTGQTTEFSGGDLALIEFAEALRTLVWFDVVAGLLLPLGIAEPGAGPLGWIIGVLAWSGKILVFSGCLAVLRSTIGRRDWGRTPLVLGIAAALGLLAALLALAGAVAA
jgi:formate hydrogenlyase subunit 4